MRASLCTLLAFSLAGCATTTTTAHDPADLDDWSDGFENTGASTTNTTSTTITQPEASDTEFNVSVPSTVTWPWMMRRWDSATGEVFADEACGIDLEDAVAGQAFEEDCVLEQDEGDLFFSGMSIFLHVPAGLCDYVVVPMYMYEAFPVGTGPTEVEYTINIDGSIDDKDTDGDGIPDSNFGTPYCGFDYGWYGGPNCCTGPYTLTVHDDQINDTVVTTEDWGGLDDLGDCFDGGAYLWSSGQFTTNNVPLVPYFFVDQGSFEYQFDFDPPALNEQPQGDGYTSSLGLANYYRLADSGGTAPVGLVNNLSYGYGALDLPLVQPTYDFICTDNAFEKLGIIHLSVREWNTEAEFKIDGDPDAGSGLLEPQAPFQPLNDLFDWKDEDPAIYVGYGD